MSGLLTGVLKERTVRYVTDTVRQSGAGAEQQRRTELTAQVNEVVADIAEGPLSEIEIPESLRDNIALFQRLERRVLKEYDPRICQLFDALLSDAIHANELVLETMACHQLQLACKRAVDRGCISMQEKQDITELWDCYHAKGWNGPGEVAYKSIQNLPVKEDC